MRLITLSPEMQQRIAVLVPLIALALSLLVVYPAWGRYGDLTKRVEEQRKELTTLRATPIPPPGPILPAAPDVPTEPPQFLGLVAGTAVATQCAIVGLDVSVNVESKDSLKAAGAVRPVRAKLDVEAPYSQIRVLLAEVARATRMLAVTDIVVDPVMVDRFKRARRGLLHASITIERYVAPPDKPSGPTS